MQYGLFMELAVIKAGQADIFAAFELLGRRIKLVDSTFHHTKFDTIDIYIDIYKYICIFKYVISKAMLIIG